MTNLAIICAMNSEVQDILDYFKCKRIKCPTTDLYKSHLGNVDLYVALSSIGKTNAAAATATLLSMIDNCTVINVGVSGSLQDYIHTGSFVVASSSEFHDQDIEIYKDFVPNTLEFSTDDSATNNVIQFLKNNNIDFFYGKLATGDNFVSSDVERDRIKEATGALCVDMESASIAHVCHKAGVPFVSVRTISDGAGDGSEDDYNKNMKDAAIAAQKAIINFIETTAISANSKLAE